MSRRLILTLIVVCFALVTALVVWKWVFRQSDDTMASKRADVEIEAIVLTHEFDGNEESANKKYLGKIIIVSGTVYSITGEEQDVAVYLKNAEDIAGVMCTFKKASFDTARIKAGDKVRIKGICDGYLMDVMLNKCSLQ